VGFGEGGYSMLLEEHEQEGRTLKYSPNSFNPGSEYSSSLIFCRTKWQQYLLFDRRQAVALENESLAAVHLLLIRTIETLCLFDILLDNDLSAVLGELSEDDRLKLQHGKVSDLATTEEGERLCKVWF
jgi:hypothetical protein